MVLVPLYDTLGPDICTIIINQGKWPIHAHSSSLRVSLECMPRHLNYHQRLNNSDNTIVAATVSSCRLSSAMWSAGSLFCTLKPAAFSSFFIFLFCICYFHCSCDRHLGLYYVSVFDPIVLWIWAFAVFSGWPEINFYYYYNYDNLDCYNAVL